MPLKRKIKLLFLVIGLFGGVGLMLFVKEWNRTPNVVDTQEEIEISISSEDLLASFITDEAAASAAYVEKTIEVEGRVKEISFLNNRYTVILQGKGEFSCLICDMNAEQMEQIRQLKKGDLITLRGICKGFLMDAILLNCILINQPNE
ncbi:MAG: hypothetical protein AAF717_16635 [Bacteroidota bacterium]